MSILTAILPGELRRDRSRTRASRQLRHADRRPPRHGRRAAFRSPPSSTSARPGRKAGTSRSRPTWRAAACRVAATRWLSTAQRSRGRRRSRVPGLYARFAELIRAGAKRRRPCPAAAGRRRACARPSGRGRAVRGNAHEAGRTARSARAASLRIHQALARQLGIAILSGEFAPGEGFGGEIEQSEALGVSRTAYREAMRILTAKGLLESRPKAGTHVTPRRQWNLLDPDVLEWMFAGTPDERFIRDLFELRGVIEPAAAALAAARHDAVDLARMDGASPGCARTASPRAEGPGRRPGIPHRAARSDAQRGACSRWRLRSPPRSAGRRASSSVSHKHPRDPLPEHVALRDAIASGKSSAGRGGDGRTLAARPGRHADH